MDPVVRHDVIDAIEQAVAASPLVTVSSVAAGGGVTTALKQWIAATERAAEFGTCRDLNPQRPLAAFADAAGDAIAAIGERDWSSAADHIAPRTDAEGPVFVIDNADRLDEASAHLTAALLDSGCRVVLGHHHAPSTNPSLELLVDGVPADDHGAVVVAPFTEAEVDAALGDGDPRAALAATGGNPLALSLYRGSDFASVAVAVLERFDRLPADGQALAAILAASPEPIPLGLLEAMGRPWESHGRQFDRSDLADALESGISLRHDKIRRVIYEELTAVRRRFVHAEILGHLGESDDLTMVMHHAVGAGDVETIITLGPLAADRAAELGAHREAARHLENVLTYEHSVPEADRTTLREALDRHLAEAVG